MKQETLQEAVLAARMQVQQRREALLPVTVYSQLAKNHPEYVPCEEIHIAINPSSSLVLTITCYYNKL